MFPRDCRGPLHCPCGTITKSTSQGERPNSHEVTTDDIHREASAAARKTFGPSTRQQVPFFFLFFSVLFCITLSLWPMLLLHWLDKRSGESHLAWDEKKNTRQQVPSNSRDGRCFLLNRCGGPVSIRPTFPTPLLQVGGFKIQCSEQTCTHPYWILVERPRLDHGLLRKHLTLHPLHRQLIEGYLSPCLPQNSSIEVDYSPRSLDNQGRKYCCVVGGQRMPRDVRLLLFGQNHSEIDLRGSFYELIRRFGMLHMPNHMPLPPITALRTLLSNDPHVQAVETLTWYHQTASFARHQQHHRGNPPIPPICPRGHPECGGNNNSTSTLATSQVH